jgi:glutaredoxin
MFLIYYKDGCPYSIKATNLFDNLKQDYEIFREVDNDTRNILNEKNHHTYPAIFYSDNNGKIFLGGFDKISNFINIINKLNKNNISETYNEIKQNFDIDYKTFLIISIIIKSKK